MRPSADITLTGPGRRARVYRLLADCYLPPRPKLSQRIDELVRSVQELEPDLLDQAKAMAGFLKAEGAGQELALDHARLFVGPFSLLAPPYGSVYFEQEGQVMGRTTAAAREFYLTEGLDLAQGFSHPADHITVELEFIHYLSARQTEASVRGDRTELKRLGEQRQKFIAHQLSPWLGAFVECVRREAGTVFYSSLAGLTKAVVEHQCPPRGVPSMPVEASQRAATVA